MTFEQTIMTIITFIGGIGLFLYGMNTMAVGLQKTAGSKMKRLLEALTRNKLIGVLVGTGVTAIIQSSSATTVMVVGFVNAGIMDLTQSVGVIMGANIGTTVTSWLVASSEWFKFFSLEKFAPIAIMAGAVLIMFFKKHKINQIGEIVIGFGILFFGLSTMSGAVSFMRESPLFAELFRSFGANPLLGILVGTVVTCIIQSSSASVSILQTLAMTGFVPWNAAVYIIMGQNIGTCITAILSSIGATRNAKRAACIHLLFNVIGTAIFSVIAIVFFSFINASFGETLINKTEISIVHSIFNVLSTLILYPFSNLLINLSKKFIPEVKNDDEKVFVHLDERILSTPSFAIQASKKEILRLGNIALDNLTDSTSAVLNRDSSIIERIFKREEKIDALEHAITQYLIKLCNIDINDRENDTITSFLHCLTDIERVGDHCENLAETAQFMIEEDIHFSETAKKELAGLIELTISCYRHSLETLEVQSKDSFRLVAEEEETTDTVVKKLRTTHIKRLANNECAPVSGVSFMDTLTNLERITDHSLNIAESVF